MNEQFEDRRLFGKVKVTCKNQDNKKVATWQARKEDVVDAILTITREQKEQGFNISIRGVHYKLVAQNLILNYPQSYQKLCKIIDDMRYSGILDWYLIKVDGAREAQLDYFAENIPDALSDTITQYKLDRQAGQHNYIEVWCEKDTLVDVLRRTTDKYHIPLCIAKGRQSSSAIYRGYQRFRMQIDQGRDCKLLYIGDHDPTGQDCIRDINDRIMRMLNNSSLEYDNCSLDYKYLLPDAFEVIPIALTIDQVNKYSLPPNFAKETDNLYTWYVETFGTEDCWEVDALDNSILLELLETTIVDLIDLDLYKNMLEREIEDKKKLRKFISTNN